MVAEGLPSVRVALSRGAALAAAVQVVLVTAAVLAYFSIRGLTEADPSTAVSRARDLLALERRLGLDVEAELQGLVLGSHAAVTVLNWVYIWGHWPVVVGTLGWLLLRHPAGFRLTRDALVVSGLIGVVVFVSYPVAPPRLADLGLVDTVTAHSRSYRVLQPPAFVNQYAAVPSLHVGWDLIVGLALARHARAAAVRALGVLMPAAMTAAVVLTGNHFVLDVVAGVVVALTGLALAARRPTRAVAPGGPGVPGPVPVGPRVPGPARGGPRVPGGAGVRGMPAAPGRAGAATEVPRPRTAPDSPERDPVP